MAGGIANGGGSHEESHYRRRGVVDLDSLRIRKIELLPTPSLGAVPCRLHGTVRTRRGDFTGFVQWDREECVGPDELDGRAAEGELSLRLDTIRAGERLTGRLVYDLDESETTETLDAPSRGVDYTIPFGLIASIVPPGREERGAQRARVILHDGEELQLERAGDLGERNAGMLIFVEGLRRPEYVPWTDVERVDFDRPPTMYPPLDGR